MADFVNRTTRQLVRSGNNPDHPVAEWIAVDRATLDQDFAAVGGYRARYAAISGDTITLMNRAARDAVDAQVLADARDALAARMEDAEDVLRAFVMLLLDERNRMAQAFNDLKNGIAGATTLLDAKSAAAGIADEPVRTLTAMKTGIRNKLGS